MRDSAQAVTVVVTHSIRPGREQEFEAWLRGICAIASRHRGYRGSVLVPQENSANERHIAFRFDSLGELEEFWSSSDSKEWRAQLDELVSQPSRYHQEIGIEHWFTMPDGAAPPSRHRMMVVVFLAILPLVTFIPARLTPWLATFMPAWLAGIVTTAVLVVLMTYLAVPLVGRLLRPWLNPARRVDLDSP